MPRMFARHSPGTPALILYRKGDSWGFCNRKKELVIPAVYDLVFGFADGLLRVQFNGKWGYMDMQGVQYWED